MDCTTNHLPLKFQLESMLRGARLLAGLPVVEVTGHTENALNCNNQHLTFEDFLKQSIGVDSCGKPAIRIKFIESCDTVVNCANNSNEDPLKNIFAYDTTAKTYALVLNKSV